MVEVKCKKCKSITNRPRNGLCISCYNSLYYKQNKGKIIASADNWRKNNPEKYRALHRRLKKERWAKLSKEEKLAISRKTELRRTPEQMEARRKYAKEYYQKNKHTQKHKDQSRQIKERRRAVINGVTCDLTKKQWEQIKKLYAHKCAYCGRRLEKLSQDHVVPISKGGSHTASNIVPSCMLCNRKKGVNPPPFVVKTYSAEELAAQT